MERQKLLITTIACIVGVLAAKDASEEGGGDTDTELTPKLKAYYKPSQQYWHKTHNVNQGNRVPHSGNMWTPRFVASLTGGVPSSEMFLPLRIRMLGLRRLHDMIERSGLAEMLAGARHFTIFAPTEDALDRFRESQTEGFMEGLMENKAALRGLLLSHIVPGTIMTVDLAGSMTIKNMAGGDLEILAAEDEKMTVGGAKLIGLMGKQDLKALNGMVHLIEDVIFPFSVIENEEDEKKPRFFSMVNL